MPVYITPDGRYIYAIETPNSGDGNSVIYDAWRAGENGGQPLPVWDRWSYEATLGSAPEPITPRPAPPGPNGPTPSPVPTPIPDPNPQPVPAPASVRVIPITNASDGELVPRMYSYWPNAWVSGRTAYVFAGHADGMAKFFEVDLLTGTVTRLGPMIGFTGTTEGWYWSRDGWVHLLDGPRMRRVSPLAAGETETLFDISDMYPGCDLWQAHSSDDGRTHSATVRDPAHPLPSGKYPYIATVVCRNGALMPPFPAQGDLDESHISGDGRHVIIEESDNMRVINLDTRDTRKLGDWEGALAHIDCGPDYIVGEADKPDPGCCALYHLDRPLTPGNKVTLFLTTNMGHVSVKNDRCLLSDDTHLSLVSLNGGGVVQLLAHGGDTGSYDFQVKGNLDPSGRVATYMIHRDGRFDVFLAVLPQ